jgi:ABC-2 type transport system ATP-binding protein
VVFQQRTLDLDLTVMQNLIYHGALHGFSTRDAKRRAVEELDRLGVIDRAGDRVRRLSGGQIRRVEIARSLLHEPRLLLLDEPTVGLDIDARQGILDHVRRLCREDGLAVLWATHLIDEALPGSRVVVMHHGKVLSSGPIERVIADAEVGDIREAFIKLTRASAADGGERAA